MDCGGRAISDDTALLPNTDGVQIRQPCWTMVCPMKTPALKWPLKDCFVGE
jgi:hypothetical protein